MGSYNGEGAPKIAFGVLVDPTSRNLDEVARLKLQALLGKGVTFGAEVSPLTAEEIEELTKVD